MKTTSECYMALLAGKTLLNTKTDDTVKMVDGMIVISNKALSGAVFSNPTIWEEYKPDWFDNIHEHGVICWVYDNNHTNRMIDIIVCYLSSASNYRFQSPIRRWDNAIPLTSLELEEFKEIALRVEGLEIMKRGPKK